MSTCGFTGERCPSKTFIAGGYFEDVVEDCGDFVGLAKGFFGLAGEEGGAHGHVAEVVVEEAVARVEVVGDGCGDDGGGDGQPERLARPEDDFAHEVADALLLLDGESLEL
uniref:Uncharacterized protein n=1 Tax=Nymphaea colorata TaxID=210225 RepID=A0A5K1HJ06_9MAGN|nr:unnamed protein product [Nymphaea colorata]